MSARSRPVAVPDLDESDDDGLTRAQLRAVAALERALGRCAAAGVAICGMDRDLIAYDAERLRAASDDVHEAQRMLAGESVLVEDHGAYRESGGW